MGRNGRTSRGQFAPSNPGGPGRPRRATERDYLAALSEACPPGVWREIIERAVIDAKDGDAKAREWLARYLIGGPKQEAESLLSLAVDEGMDSDPVAEEIKHRRMLTERAERGPMPMVVDRGPATASEPSSC
jgi:hypothetical protein